MDDFFLPFTKLIFMNWFVYIIQSEVDGNYYKGITQNIEKRLSEHNSGESKFTSTKLPWKLVYTKAFKCTRDVYKNSFALHMNRIIKKEFDEVKSNLNNISINI